MTCKVCGRTQQRLFPRRYPLHTIHGRIDFYEMLCWRCFAWSDVSSPVFGHLYNVK